MTVLIATPSLPMDVRMHKLHSVQDTHEIKSEPQTRTAEITTALATANLEPADRAAFAVTSRLLASIVTESLLRAFYVPVKSNLVAGVCVILSIHVISEQPILERSIRPADVFAIIPLHHAPIFKGVAGKHGRPVWLLDPFDMLPWVYELSDRKPGDPENNDVQNAILSSLVPPPWELGNFTSLSQTLDPLHWWSKFAGTVMMGDDLRANLAEELASSSTWQRTVYENPPPCPNLFSPLIDWEQCLVEGHPTHPMHRARRTLAPLPSVSPDTRNWYRPRIRFAVVPRERVDILGRFEEEIRALAQVAAERSGITMPDDGRVIMPVYDLQIPNLEAKFDGIQILDEAFSLEALGQASIRTVVVPEAPHLALKLAVGITVSSALRTISHFTANLGPRFSEIVPKLKINPAILHIERESASAVYARDGEGKPVNPDIAKHFTAVLRTPYVPAYDEAVIVCAALSEHGHKDAMTGVPVVQHIFGLDTEEMRVAFFEDYARVLIDALLPPMIYNGLAFEAHPQNTLLRVSRSTSKIVGFVLRDLGGLRLHPETFTTSIGESFEFLTDHCIVTATREEAAKKLYHTLVHNHLQRLIRVLGLHYNGKGWEIVRANMERHVKQDSWLWDVWMSERGQSVAGKCLLRMKIQGLYRDSVYEPFPNMIHYRPQEDQAA
ncbi:hypothetical protein EW146_g4821 [Bondarzewia mesenterica]|uniref:Aerobactin siderophore biosynthesis IucA/IucC N-terminal domain-containing protein n=1 Tax=Bondarzewia mesenterica TaxID=1095465 RepID=A0A4S4LTV8_9AGAM|nr:hypothetical protein EW146_g4821 [Bondarzewia mesenterica]